MRLSYWAATHPLTSCTITTLIGVLLSFLLTPFTTNLARVYERAPGNWKDFRRARKVERLRLLELSRRDSSAKLGLSLARAAIVAALGCALNLCMFAWEQNYLQAEVVSRHLNVEQHGFMLSTMGLNAELVLCYTLLMTSMTFMISLGSLSVTKDSLTKFRQTLEPLSRTEFALLERS